MCEYFTLLLTHWTLIFQASCWSCLHFILKFEDDMIMKVCSFSENENTTFIIIWIKFTELKKISPEISLSSKARFTVKQNVLLSRYIASQFTVIFAKVFVSTECTRELVYEVVESFTSRFRCGAKRVWKIFQNRLCPAARAVFRLDLSLNSWKESKIAWPY